MQFYFSRCYLTCFSSCVFYYGSMNQKNNIILFPFARNFTAGCQGLGQIEVNWRPLSTWILWTSDEFQGPSQFHSHNPCPRRNVSFVVRASNSHRSLPRIFQPINLGIHDLPLSHFHEMLPEWIWVLEQIKITNALIISNGVNHITSKHPCFEINVNHKNN